jgi:hypothetical protein
MNQKFEPLNEEAISTLRHVLTGGAEAARQVQAWITRIQNRQNEGEPLTVLEHTAMAYVLRSGFLDFLSNVGPQQKVESVLAKSWLHMTGKRLDSKSLTGRLPRSTLRTASREARLFHLAAFQLRGAKATGSQKSVGRDYTPTFGDLVVITGLVAIAFTDMGKAILGGAAMGYAISTLAEYSMHRWAGHEAGRQIKPLLRKLGCIGQKVLNHLEATYVRHFVIHHVKTSNRYYTTQFSSDPPGDQLTIDAELDALGDVGRHIKKSDYGMTLTHTGVMTGLLATLPIHMTLILVLGLEPVSAVALMAPSLLHVWASKILHPYLHKRRDEVMKTSSPFVCFLLRTRYAEWISRSHWIHHKGGGGNFNLIPGADLVFGDFRKPNLDLVFRMQADHILGADWAAPARPSARGLPCCFQCADNLLRIERCQLAQVFHRVQTTPAYSHGLDRASRPPRGADRERCATSFRSRILRREEKSDPSSGK